jgi:hypothetical protein
MSEYIIDITIENIYDNDICNYHYITFYIKIDKNGNIDIKKKYTYLQTGIPNRDGPIHDFVVINDNIPIPFYVINILKNSFRKPTEGSKKLPGGPGTRNPLHLQHYENAIENIIILKEDIAKCNATIIDLI